MSKTFYEKYQYPIVFLLLAIFFISATASMAQKAATSDEVTHLAAGYSYWKTQDYRMNEEHPPLMKLMAGFPLLFINPTLHTDNAYWEEDDQWKFAKEFLYSGENNPDQLLFWGRIPFVLLGLLLGIYIFRWAKELYGIKAGLFALTLYVFSPNILANTRLVHTDLGITALLFITIYYFSKLLEESTWKNAIIVGVLVGLTNATKFTGIYLFPIMVTLFLVHFYYKKLERKIYYYKKEEVKKYLKQWTTIAMIILACCAIIITLSYMVVNVSQYPAGLQFVIEHSTDGHPNFLFGEYSIEGWWYYFILAFLIKTPLPIIILLMSTIVFFNNVKHKDPLQEWILIIPMIFYLIAFMLNDINIGIRHILPCYAFIFIFVSKIVNIEIKKKRIVQIALIILAVWYIFSSITIYPHYLSYFNEAVGGPDNGQEYLLDSNIDWGQDAKLLQEWLNEEGLNNKETRVEIFTNERINNPKTLSDLYRFKVNRIPCQPTSGIIAISVNKRFNMGQLHEKNCVAWLEEYTPFKKIGYSIFVYNITDEKLIEQKQTCIQTCTASCEAKEETFSDFIYKDDRCICSCD